MFLAIDGVAPRAKMNQQRSRRFRSSKEREALIADYVRALFFSMNRWIMNYHSLTRLRKKERCQTSNHLTPIVLLLVQSSCID